MEKIIDLMQVCEERKLAFQVNGYYFENSPMEFRITAWIPKNDKRSINFLASFGMSYNDDNEKFVIMQYESEV